jgi:hypothetical protein
MLQPSAMIMADRATRRHALSAHPQAPILSARLPRQRGNATRRLTAAALRRLANHVEPRRGYTSAPVV